MAFDDDNPALDSIGWEAAAVEMDRVEMDRVLASASNRALPSQANQGSINGAAPPFLPAKHDSGCSSVPMNGKRWNAENENAPVAGRTGYPRHNSPRPEFSEEQRSRMEENRRRALERKKSTLGAQPNSSTNCTSPSISREQRARMEENRRKALEKKQWTTQPSTQAAETTSQRPSATLLDVEQRARMAENRQKALELRQQTSQSSNPATQCMSQAVYSNDQRARMEENRRRALEKKRQRLGASQASSGMVAPAASCAPHRALGSKKGRHVCIGGISPKQVPQVPAQRAPALPTNGLESPRPAKLNDEQRARMEENKRKAFAKKQKLKLKSNHCPSETLGTTDVRGPPSAITEEQRLRMEESKKNALQRKQQKSALSQSDAHLPTCAEGTACLSQTTTTSSMKRSPPTIIDEQRLRMEENRKDALERKRQKSDPTQNDAQTRTRAPIIPPPSRTNVPSSMKRPPPAATGEKRLGMEEKGKGALEDTQQKSALTQSDADMPACSEGTACPSQATVTTSMKCPPSNIGDEQRLWMEENRKSSLERKQQKPASSKVDAHILSAPLAMDVMESKDDQQSALTQDDAKCIPFTSETTVTSSMKCPSPTIANEQRLQTKEKRKGTLERKQQNPALSQSDSHILSAPPAIEALETKDPMTCHENLDVTARTDGQRASEEGAQAEPTKQEPHRTCHGNIDVAPHTEENAQLESNEPKSSSPEMPKSTKMAETDLVDVSTLDSLRADGEKAHPPSPMKPPSAKKKSALPPIPSELQYDEEKVLPVDDDDLGSLIENACLDQPLLNDWELFDHQKEGVLRALKMRRLILAYDMGLGKTVIGCVWAKSFLNTFDGLKIFVIAPVSLHEEWKRTATQTTGLKIDDADKKKGAKTKKKKGQNAKKTVTGKRKKRKKSEDSDSEDDPSSVTDFDLYILSWNSISSFKDIISKTRPNGYVVICDEAHHMQSMTSKRTEEALKLVKPKSCRGVLLLTGTPMKNGKPSNIFPLLRAVKHPFGDHQRKFEFFFCNGQQKTFRGVTSWDASGSSNLKELHAHTASHIFRKTKEECMSKDLPPRKRIMKDVSVSPRHQLRYTQAMKDLAEAFTKSAEHENEDLLSPFHHLRIISANSKVNATVALSNSILKDESSIVIFTTFVAVAKEIHKKLEDMEWGGEILTGETPPKKRQAMVDRFQSGLSPVFVTTYGAGGVGLTLTAACTVILVDRAWTPGDVCQAEDRVRRIGQKRPVRSIWLRAFPIDKQIDSLIDHKEANSSTAVDGKDNGGHNKPAPKVSISQLVKSVLCNDENGGDPKINHS